MKNKMNKILFILSILVLTAGCTSSSGKPANNSEGNPGTPLQVEEDAEIEIDEDMDSGGF